MALAAPALGALTPGGGLSGQRATGSTSSNAAPGPDVSAAWRLGAESRRLLLAKHRLAGVGIGTWNGEAAEAERVIAGFERLVGLDTVRNEVVLHSQIHRWLTAPPAFAPGFDLEAFNERVYAELFLTPSSDPWLGLVSPETYLALEPVSSSGPAASEPASAEPASRSRAATMRRAEGALR